MVLGFGNESPSAYKIQEGFGFDGTPPPEPSSESGDPIDVEMMSGPALPTFDELQQAQSPQPDIGPALPTFEELQQMKDTEEVMSGPALPTFAELQQMKDTEEVMSGPALPTFQELENSRTKQESEGNDCYCIVIVLLWYILFILICNLLGKSEETRESTAASEVDMTVIEQAGLSRIMNFMKLYIFLLI